MAVDINLNDVQQEPIVVSASLTADLNKVYVNVASATYTDPSPTEGKGFIVIVRNGTATVGGTGYSTAGQVVYRIYHSGAWANYVHVSTTTANTWDLLQTFTSGVFTNTITNADGELLVTRTTAGRILLFTNGRALHLSAQAGGNPSIVLNTDGTIKLENGTVSSVLETDASNLITFATKNTAYNKNFDTTAGTVCEGNDSRLTNSRVQSIYSNVTPFTSTTTATDELAQSVLIPAGTLTTTDFFDVLNWGSRTGTAGNKTTKVWINSSNTLSGATQIAQFENTSTAGTQLFYRTFAIKNNTTIRGLTTPTALAPGYISVATLGTDITIPTLASNVYVMISISRTNSGDTHISEALQVVPKKAV